ncbi:MAG: DNA-formamidopyrimidine glycosylase [Candidatus Izemoplasma sp.]|nr:DNA-formamidopyrimidine glycosylase [Candidatus Izemoplasma sp.]
MPELPEVETVKRSLKHLVAGKTIRDVDVFIPKMVRNTSIEQFKSILENTTIADISRIGKYLLFHLGDWFLISHLRMEGRYFIKPLDQGKDKHEHVIFYFQDGLTMRYHDTRKFGTFDLIKQSDLPDFEPIQKMGPEPFDDRMTVDYLYPILKRKTIAIKSALLDQNIIAGLGNIYVNEVLFLCGLHPETPSHNIRKKDVKNIIKYSRNVLTEAIKQGGTTIRSYTSSLGVTGRFQQQLNVHGQDICKQCGQEILKIKVGGRGTYYCKKCQKKRY